MNNYVLTLYVAGQTVRSQRAVDNLRRICEDALAGRYELQVVDVLEQPELAEQRKILATPTLIRELPPPARWLIGDLSDAHKVLVGLGIEV